MRTFVYSVGYGRFEDAFQIKQYELGAVSREQIIQNLTMNSQ
jgi:hypothetical protein